MLFPDPPPQPHTALSCSGSTAWYVKRGVQPQTASSVVTESRAEAIQVPRLAAGLRDANAQLKQSFQTTTAHCGDSGTENSCPLPALLHDRVWSVFSFLWRCVVAYFSIVRPCTTLALETCSMLKLTGQSQNNPFPCILCKHHNYHLWLIPTFKVITISRTKQGSKPKGRSVCNR